MCGKNTSSKKRENTHETILSALQVLAELSERGLDLLRVLAHRIVEILGEFVEYADADLTVALLECGNAWDDYCGR